MIMIMIAHHGCDIDFDVDQNSCENLTIWQMLMLPMMRISGCNLADDNLDVDVADDNWDVDVADDNADGADDRD